MKADLHVHSCYSNDGVSTPEQIVERAIEMGLGCVAITDHNSFKAYHDVKDNGRIIIIPAEEVSSQDGHILAFGIDRQIARGMTIKETIEAIHEAGGYAFAAHPYRWWSGLGEKNTLDNPFDGTESRNARSVPRDNRRSQKLAKRIGKPISAGSDAHSPSRIGSGFVEFPDGLKTWEEVVASLMKGEAVADSESRGRIASFRYGIKSIGQWMFRGFHKM